VEIVSVQRARDLDAGHDLDATVRRGLARSMPSTES
jgi:hypothetical protein